MLTPFKIDPVARKIQRGEYLYGMIEIHLKQMSRELSLLYSDIMH
jgi:hypothetical protein